MPRAGETSPQLPWAYADVQANRVASADWGENHPAFCYEIGDPHGEPFIPTGVLERVFMQHQFVVVLWQEHEITRIDVSHDPDRTFRPIRMFEASSGTNWTDVMRFEVKRDNPKLRAREENLDPRQVLYGLATVLRVPFGHPLHDEDQRLLPLTEPIMRVLIEFPDAVETEPLPLDTGITALGALASQEYLNTIYGSRKV